jgi:hypothetical protein
MMWERHNELYTILSLYKDNMKAYISLSWRELFRGLCSSSEKIIKKSLFFLTKWMCRLILKVVSENS